jgi:hypothetical protein
MSYRDAIQHGETNVGLGMVPCKPNCKCPECQIARLRAENEALRELLLESRDMLSTVVEYDDEESLLQRIDTNLGERR